MFGLVSSVFINCFIGIGSILYGQKPNLKELSTTACINITSTFYNSTSLQTTAQTPLNNPAIIVNTGLNRLFDISYYWYSLIAMVVVFSVGIVVSLSTKRYNKKDLDDEMFFHLFRRFTNRKVRKIILNQK